MHTNSNDARIIVQAREREDVGKKKSTRGVRQRVTGVERFEQSSSA
jgi:hypothetical protein